MAATRVDGTGSSKRLPYLLYEVITNNATTYTLRLSLGVNNKNSGAAGTYTATTESYISKKIGSGAASFVYASSSVRVPYGDTIIISNTTWTITKTHASQSISVGGVPYLDHAPVGSVVKTLTVPAKTSYAVTYNANSGSGAPAQQTKWYNETLTLSAAKPTKAGYTFKGWATSEANAKAGTVAYASGATVEAGTNSALTLWAVWELTYSKPTITNLHVERCDAQGVADDEGTLALVTFDWSVFRSSATRYYNGTTTPYASTTVQSCSVAVGSETATPTLTGASGSASVVVGSAGSFLTDTQYNASVMITDTVDSAIQPTHSSTASATLATTFFPMDFNANASAVGFFRPAPDDGDGVYFGKPIHVTGGIEASGNVMAQGMAGMIQMFAGKTPPNGWLLCDGSSKLISDYPELAAALYDSTSSSYIYGSADSTHFNLPDFRGKFPLGVSSSHPLTGTGSTGGSENATLVSHSHGSGSLTMDEKGGHAHKIRLNDVGASGSARNIPVSNAALSSNTFTDTVGSHKHTISGSTETKGSSATGANMPPYRTVNFIIATGKTS